MNGTALELLIDGSRGGFRVCRAGWTKPVSGWLLRPPFLAPGQDPKVTACRAGDKELVCRVLDASNVLLGEYGWSLRRRRWVDLIPREPSASFDAFRKAYPPKDLHTLRVPAGTEAASLELECRILLRSGRVRVRGRRVYEVTRDDLHQPLLVPESRGAGGRLLAEAQRIAAVGEGKGLPRRWQGRRAGDGSDIPEPLPGRKARMDGGFDIVITGDGFTRSQQPEFIDLARQLRERLRAATRLGGRGARFHIVPAVSRDSGIETKASRRKDTFYEIFCFDRDRAANVTAPAGYMPARLGPFIRGTRNVGPWEWIDLVIVIVNFAEPRMGGHAWPDLKLVVVPRISGESLFADAVTHEAAHVIAHLADEVSEPHGAPMEDVLRPAPNQAALRQVAQSVRDAAERTYGMPLRAGWEPPPDSIWWRALSPTFTVHLPGEPDPGKAAAKALGAFWGCQHVTGRRATARVLRAILASGLGPAVDTLKKSDRRGLRRMFHYRPTSECLMSGWETGGKAGASLCAVCRLVVEDVMKGTCRYPDWSQPPVKSGLGCVP